MLKVFVNLPGPRNENMSQMLGVARRDLYLLEAEGFFEVNFLKGIIGEWFITMLVLGMAVSLSTYLSGIISFLCTVFLFGAGLFKEYVQQLANNQLEGGGPFEALSRLVTRTQISVPLEASSAATIISGTDEALPLGPAPFPQLPPRRRPL